MSDLTTALRDNLEFEISLAEDNVEFGAITAQAAVVPAEATGRHIFPAFLTSLSNKPGSSMG
ncbi:MAG: hypothetical protein GY807_04600 [Gammaproteobacteria bacterium]|nr:hypothetical protein [Gammaproteobacteria bacterium]